MASTTAPGNDAQTPTTGHGDATPETATTDGDATPKALTNDGDATPKALTSDGDATSKALTSDGDATSKPATSARDATQDPATVAPDATPEPAETTTSDACPTSDARTSDHDATQKPVADAQHATPEPATSDGDAAPDDVTRAARRRARRDELRARQGARSARGRRHGLALQLADRELDQAARLEALDCLDRLRAQGVSRARVAELLGRPERTLADWDLQRRVGQLHPTALGRPAHEAPASTRDLALGLLTLFGPQTSARCLGETLGALLPAAERPSRRQVEELLARYRELYRERNRVLTHALDWSRAGVVWAMDFTLAPHSLEDDRRPILVVRDLASGFTLEALPVRAADAETAGAVLQRLFLREGPPLVLKSDNGSHFTGAAVQRLLARYGVTWLPSPPYTPGYNGAVEAGIRGLKRRAAAAAAAAGRDHWLVADVEAARRQANVDNHPRRLRGATPAEVWAERAPVDVGLRVAFLAACRRGRTLAALDRGELDLASLNKLDRAAVERQVVTRALVEYGFLSFRRRRIAPPVRRLKLADMR